MKDSEQIVKLGINAIELMLNGEVECGQFDAEKFAPELALSKTIYQSVKDGKQECFDINGINSATAFSICLIAVFCEVDVVRIFKAEFDHAYWVRFTEVVSLIADLDFFGSYRADTINEFTAHLNK
ncbi:MAG: hypothetical protein IBX55_21670 [Methyloprofundus sp.]|nr:hypothetical protein [Methyloprofundus sp.]